MAPDRPVMAVPNGAVPSGWWSANDHQAVSRIIAVQVHGALAVWPVRQPLAAERTRRVAHQASWRNHVRRDPIATGGPNVTLEDPGREPSYTGTVLPRGPVEGAFTRRFVLVVIDGAVASVAREQPQVA